MTACYNPDGSHKKGGCDKEATNTLVGKKKSWHLCDEHFKQCSEFVASVKTALGKDDIAYQ